MSTPRVTIFRSRECDAPPWNGEQMVDTVWLFRRFDGDPKVHGKLLKRVLSDKFTAMSCLVASFSRELFSQYKEHAKAQRWKTDMMPYVHFLTEEQARQIEAQYLYIVYLDYPPGRLSILRDPMQVIVEVYRQAIGAPEVLEPGERLYKGPIRRYRPKSPEYGVPAVDATPRKPKPESSPDEPDAPPLPEQLTEEMSDEEVLRCEFVAAFTRSAGWAGQGLCTDQTLLKAGYHAWLEGEARVLEDDSVDHRKLGGSMGRAWKECNT